MFMEREEFRYGIALGKLQLRYCSIGYIVGMIVYIVDMIFDNFVGIAVINSMNEAHFRIEHVTTGIGFILAIYTLVFLIMGSAYRQFRTSQEIYPQNNKSRFVANAMADYAYILGMTLSSMLIGIGLLIFLPILEKNNSNIALTGSFMIQDIFIIAAVVFGYGILIQSIVLLIFSCIRRFKIWMCAFVLVLVMWMSYDYSSLFAIVWKMVQFYTKESVLLWFLIKVILTFLILTCCSYMLAVYTEFHGGEMKRKQKLSFVGVVGILFVSILIGVGSLSFTVYTETEVLISDEEVVDSNREGIEIDVSHLEPGTEIQVEAIGNIEMPTGNISGESYDNDDYLHVVCEDVLIVEGDTMYLDYLKGSSVENGVDVYDYLQPEFTYELEGNILKLEYEIKNPNVFIINVKNQFAEKFNAESKIDSQLFGVYGYATSMLYIEMS